jgi:DNA-binding transcriptional MerR regulator
MSPRLLSIGRFAQLSGLTVRALRIYDEQGLLRPEAVDGDSRYRYYGGEQLEHAELIRRLRQTDMPLDEIGRFLRGTPAQQEEVLAGHHARLRARATAAADAMRVLHMMSKENPMSTEQRHAQVFPMVLKRLYDQHVLRIRYIWRESETHDVGQEIAEVFASLQTQGLGMTGPPYFSCSAPDDEGARRVEVGIPVEHEGAAEARVESGTQAGSKVATTHYQGPYDGIGAAYRHLWVEIENAGLTPNGDPREVYLTSPDNTPDPRNYFTEVVWPVTG